MKKAIVFFLVLISISALRANPQELFAKANQAYQAGDFNQAVVLYDSIVNLGYNHPETYFNLANAHYRLNHVGPAILNYEKALKLDPKNEEIQHNLALANKAVVDEFNVLPTPAIARITRDFSSIFSSSTWSVLGIVFLLATFLFSFLFLFVNQKSVFIAVAVITLFSAVLVEGVAYQKYLFEQERFVVITSSNSYVKSAPATTAEDLFILHEGTKCKVLDEFDEWQKIKLPDGKIGWIKTETISAI